MLIKTKNKKLNVRRDACWIVLMKDQKPGPSHGQWAPVSTHGFTVVCLSKYDAAELCWFLGPKIGYSPPEQDMEEERYLDWLLNVAQIFRLQPHHARGDLDRPGTGGEVVARFFYAGWYPNAEDILAIPDTVAIAQMALKARLNR